MNKEIESKLKPCPFCGGKAERDYHEQPNGIMYKRIYCTNIFCKISQPYGSYRRDEAIKAWNTRHTDTKLTQLAEENEKPRLIKIKCEVNETEQDEIVQTLINKIEKESIKAFETNYNEWKVYCEQFQATNTELQGKLAELPDDEEIASIIELNLADIYKEYLDFDDRIFIAQAITDRIKKGKG